MQATGREGRWDEHNSARQTRILEAAVELLDETDPGVAIPVQQIASRAGLAKSVVYRQFAGKDELERRIRSYLLDGFFATLNDRLDIGTGSIDEVLTRTVRAVADWAGDHRHRHEFMRAGPIAADDSGLDAIAVLKTRVAGRAREILEPITAMLGVDYEPFETLPYALVSMVEGTLSHWVGDPEPTRSRGEIVADLAALAWYALDGAARSVGLQPDPELELADAISRLTADPPSPLPA